LTATPACSILCELIEPLEADVCVITGDFREGTFEDYETPARRMAELCSKIRAPVVCRTRQSRRD
jgi:hypothetical protein